MSSASRVLLTALLLLTACRLALAAMLEVTPQEACLWEWSRRWTLAGYDGGGLVPLLIKAGTFFGSEPLALRWFAPVAAAASSWVLYRLVRSFSSERAAAWAVVLLNFLPAFNHGAVLAATDGPATTLGLLGLLLFWKGLHRAGKWDWHWPASGALWGLALLCSWSAAWLPGGAVFLCAAFRRWRGRLLSPGLWLLLAVWAAVGLGPVFWWNHTHAGAGWRHLAEHSGATGAGLQIGGLWELLTHAIVGISPIVLAGVGIAGAMAVRRRPLDGGTALLLAFIVPPVALCLGGSLFGMTRPSYLLPVLPAAAALYAAVWFGSAELPAGRSAGKWARLRQSFHWNALLLAGLMSLAGLNTDVLRRTGLLHSYQWDATRNGRGWRQTAEETASLIREAARGTPDWLFLIASDHRLASALNYHLPPDLPIFQPDPEWPRVHVVESPVPTSQYAFWPRYDAESPPDPSPMFGKTALYFSDDNGRSGPPDAIVRAFAEVTPLMVFDITRGGAVIRRIRVFACYDYAGLPL